MSYFGASSANIFGTRRDSQEEELSLPLYNANNNRSSGFLAPSGANPPTSRSSSPRPPEIRIARPSSPVQQFINAAPPVPGFLRRGWRVSWQTALLVVLGLYTFYTLVRSPVYRTADPVVASYEGGQPRKDITHLVMVAGHAIWMGGNTLGEDEKEWTLLPYQHGLAKTFKQHIQKGVDIAKESETSLLVFSGGETRNFAGPSSEAQSYWSLAYLSKLIEPNSSLFNRSTTEEFARDSYENLLFSICRFHEYTSTYPSKITVIGFEFKRARFETVHRHALRYKLDQFEYIGIDPQDDEDQLLHFAEGEKSGPLSQFQQDPHGCADEVLVSKRKGRNPFRVRHGYEVSCPELRPLLAWCSQKESVKDGKGQPYLGEVPWVAESTSRI